LQNSPSIGEGEEPKGSLEIIWKPVSKLKVEKATLYYGDLGFQIKLSKFIRNLVVRGVYFCGWESFC